MSFGDFLGGAMGGGSSGGDGGGFMQYDGFGNDIRSLVRHKWDQDRFQDQREDAERAMQWQTAQSIEQANAMWEKNYAAQKEFAQHGIQWRAEDAAAAGMHPLYAIQGGGAAYAPSFSVGVGGYSGSGTGGAVGLESQNYSRAARAVMTPEMRAEHELRLRLLESQIEANDVRTFGIWDEITRRDNGPGMPTQDPNVMASQLPGVSLGVVTPAADQVRVRPAEAESYASNDPSSSAAVNPGWQPFRQADGNVWWLPSKAMSEPLESVSESLVMKLMVLMENIKRNPNFLHENRNLIPGMGIYEWLQRKSRPLFRGTEEDFYQGR